MRIGLIGAGALGHAVGLRVLRGGHELGVYDRNTDRVEALVRHGAVAAADGPTLGRQSTVLISALPDGAAVTATFLEDRGPWAAAEPGTAHLELSFVGPECVGELAKAASARGIRFLDCATSRGSSADGRVTLTMWVGGNADQFDSLHSLLDLLAERVLYCGGVGQGQVTKLVNNLVSHQLTVVLGEALALGVRAGASIDLLRNALHDGTAQTRMLDELLPASLLRGDWTPGLRLDLALKDLGLARELAEQLEVPLTTLEAAERLYREAAARGWGDLSAHAVLRLVERASGATLRSAIFQALNGTPGSDTGDGR